MRNKIWIHVLRQYNLHGGQTNGEVEDKLYHIILDENETSKAVVEKIKKSFNIPEYGVILKLRNHRGSLIPINSSILPNSKTVPYTLELVEEHQYVKPKEKAKKINTYHETMKEVLSGFEERISKLENKLPNLSNEQREKNEQDIQYLDQKITFLNQRFNEAESANWVGMFKKNPMW